MDMLDKIIVHLLWNVAFFRNVQSVAEMQMKFNKNA